MREAVLGSRHFFFSSRHIFLIFAPPLHRAFIFFSHLILAPLVKTISTTKKIAPLSRTYLYKNLAHNLFTKCTLSPGSRLLSHFSCLLSLVSCLSSPVSSLLPHGSCLTSPVSRFLCNIFCPKSHVRSHASGLKSPVSRILSDVSCLMCLAVSNSAELFQAKTNFVYQQ